MWQSLCKQHPGQDEVTRLTHQKAILAGFDSLRIPMMSIWIQQRGSCTLYTIQTLTSELFLEQNSSSKGSTWFCQLAQQSRYADEQTPDQQDPWQHWLHCLHRTYRDPFACSILLWQCPIQAYTHQISMSYCVNLGAKMNTSGSHLVENSKSADKQQSEAPTYFASWRLIEAQLQVGGKWEMEGL